jgi:hypothetical protein
VLLAAGLWRFRKALQLSALPGLPWRAKRMPEAKKVGV